MSRLKKLCLMVVFSGMTVVVVPSLNAQLARKAYQATVGSVVKDVRETRRDYKLDKPFQYQPSDPWYRGKLYRFHTGHYGLFYNCDGEECKRESPYICWKLNDQRDFPKFKGIRYYIRQDLDEIGSRVGNGGCNPHAPCPPCSQCVKDENSGCNCANERGYQNDYQGEILIGQQPSTESVERQPIRVHRPTSGLLARNAWQTRTQDKQTTRDEPRMWMAGQESQHPIGSAILPTGKAPAMQTPTNQMSDTDPLAARNRQASNRIQLDRNSRVIAVAAQREAPSLFRSAKNYLERKNPSDSSRSEPVVRTASTDSPQQPCDCPNCRAKRR